MENPLLYLEIFLFFINYIYAELNYFISFLYIAAHEFIMNSLLQGYITEQRKIDWRKKNSGVPIPQASVLGRLLFLICINDLTDAIMSTCKIFADDTSLFRKIIYTRNSQNTLNSDLKIIKNWAYQWKVQFNPDPKKQGNEVTFSRKRNTCTYPPVTFNKNIIATCPHQKHLGVVLDSKLDFSIHIDQKIGKCNKIIGLIR